MAWKLRRTGLLIRLLIASAAETIMKRLLTLLILGLLLASCDGGSTQEYHGALYFGRGAYLLRFSLGDGSLSIAGHLGDTTIRQVTALGNDNLLIAESASVNRRRVPRISWVDLRTGETANLYSGVWAEHLADRSAVITVLPSRSIRKAAPGKPMVLSRVF